MVPRAGRRSPCCNRGRDRGDRARAVRRGRSCTRRSQESHGPGRPGGEHPRAPPCRARNGHRAERIGRSRGHLEIAAPSSQSRLRARGFALRAPMAPGEARDRAHGVPSWEHRRVAARGTRGARRGTTLRPDAARTRGLGPRQALKCATLAQSLTGRLRCALYTWNAGASAQPAVFPAAFLIVNLMFDRFERLERRHRALRPFVR